MSGLESWFDNVGLSSILLLCVKNGEAIDDDGKSFLLFGDMYPFGGFCKYILIAVDWLSNPSWVLA